MNKALFEEENLYVVGESLLSRETYAAMRQTIEDNQAVGILAGYYDRDLTIAYIGEFFLHNLGYTYDEFMERFSGSLKNVFHGENNTFVENERFKKIQGAGEAQILNKDGAPINVRVCKADTADSTGAPLWILSTHIDEMQENLELVNQVLSSGFWAVECDSQGNPETVFFSHEFRKMLGYHDTLDFPNSLDVWEDGIHPRDREMVDKAFQEAFLDKTDQKKYDVEYRMRMADGRYQWFKDKGEVRRRADGTAFRMAGIFINIDREKRAKQHTQRVDAFHRAYTTANLCEYYVDLQENSFNSLKVEETLSGLFEESSTWDEMIGCFTDTYVIKEDQKMMKHFYDRSYIARKLEEGRGEINLECRILLNGDVRWVRNVIIRDTALDTFRYALIFVRDITDAKREEANLQQLTDQNRIMDQLIQGTVKLVDRYAACDLERDIYHFYSQNINDSAYAPTGSYHEFVKVMASRFRTISGDLTMEQAFSAENIRKMLKGPEDIYRFEYCSLDEKQFKSIAISPLEWVDGKATAVLFMSQDTTAEKLVEIKSRKALKEAYEAANRASHAKTEFLSNMSHDIRTPMNAIIGMTAIAGANIENQDRVVDCLGKITQSSRHLLSLINEVLDMSRIESGKITLMDEEFNLSDLCDNLVSMIKTQTDLHRHDFEVHINRIEHEEVCGDSMRIQQMVTNILSNAVKYTADGGRIDFTITELPSSSKGIGCYEFAVQDNGMGMTKEFQKIMFEPFTRADDMRTSKIQGTGLGMTIARNFAQMMNGDIKVESELGKGTRFTATIFLKLQNKEITAIEELIDLPVLVVDDDQNCCENTVALLEEIGIDGEWVTSGEEAVNLVAARYEKENDYFAIIIDWKMPGMDGLETTRQIRKIVGSDVTIIILSAYDYSEIEQEAKEAGVDEFIAKPLFRSRLTATFKNIIEGKPSSDAKHYLSDIAECDYRGKRVLLVEDNDLNSEIAKEIIGMTGAEVVIAENGKTAVDMISSGNGGDFDLIFMDIQMPVMNGYEATAAIRTSNIPAARSVPIVAMTANAFAEDVQLAKSAGMNEHISKPLDMTRLRDVMRKWL